MGGFCEMPDEDFQDVIMPGIESAVLPGSDSGCVRRSACAASQSCSRWCKRWMTDTFLHLHRLELCGST